MLRRLALAVGGLLGLLILVALGFATWISTVGGERWLKDRLEDAVGGLMTEGWFEIGDLAVDVRTGLVARDLALRDDDGRPLVQVGLLAADLDLQHLATWRVDVPRARLEGVRVDLAMQDNGVLDLMRLFGQTAPAPPSDEPWGGLPIDFDVGELELAGVTVTYRGPDGPIVALAGASGTAGVTGRGDRIEVSDLALGTQVSHPGPVVATVRGALVYDGEDGLELSRTTLALPHADVVGKGTIGDTLALELEVQRAWLRAFDPLLGDAGLGGRWQADVSVDGPLEALVVEASLDGLGESRGSVRARATADLAAERPTWTLDGRLDALHVGDIYVPLETPVVLGGDLDLQGTGLTWPDDLQATGRWVGQEQVFGGQPVDAVDISFLLDDSRLELSESVVDGIVGVLQLDGELYLQDGPMDVRVRGTLEPRRLAELGATGFEHAGLVDARIRGDLQDSDAPIRAYGSASWGPFGYDGTVSMAALRVGFDVDVLGGDVRGTASASGRGLDASGVRSETLRGDGLTLRVIDGRTRLEGTLGLQQVAYDPVFTVSDVGVDLSVDVEEDRRSVEAVLQLATWTLLDRPGGPGGRGRVSVDGDTVGYRVELYDQGRAALEVDGTYAMQSSGVQVDTLHYAPTPRATWRNMGPLTLTVADGGMRDARIGLQSELGTLSVRGDLGTTGALDGTVRIDALQLDHLAELYPDRMGGTSGTLDLGLRLTGDASDPVVGGTVDLDGLFLEDTVRWLDAEGRLDLEGGVFRPTLDLAVADDPLGRLEGTIPVDSDLSDPGLRSRDEAVVTLAIKPGDFERLGHLSPSAEEAGLPRGELSAMIEARGPLADPELSMAGVANVEVVGWKRPGRVEFDLQREDTTLDFWSDLRTDFQQRATVSGGGATRLGEVIAWSVEGTGTEPALDDLEMYLDDMTIAGVLLGVPVTSLVALADAPTTVAMDGELVGGITVTGSPTLPKVEGGLHWLDASIGGEPLDAASLSLLGTEDGYATDLHMTFAKGGGLTLTGDVPITVDLDRELEDWSTDELALQIGGEGIPLAVASAFEPAIRRADGLLAVEGRIGGTITDPAPVVSARIDGATLQYTELGLTYEDIDVAIDADRDQVTWEVSAVSEPTRKLRSGAGLDLDLEGAGDPRMSTTGTARLEEWEPTEITGDVQLRGGAWLASNDDANLRVDGDLALSGTWPELVVGGDLDVIYGRMLLDAAAFLDAAPLEPSSAITFVRGEEARRREADDEPPLYADFDVDVNVDLQRNVELDVSLPFIDDLGSLGAAVTRVDLNTRLGGDVDVALRRGEPTLIGEVELLEGKVRMLQSNFDLTDGTLSFTGGDYTNPFLDVEAEMALTGATLEMKISGTPSDPEFGLYSDQYPDRTQQMTILLTGRAPDELTADEGAGTAQALAGLLFNSLLAGQSLGTLSIEPDGAVKLGVPVSNKVYASTRFSPTTDPTKNSLAVELEWSLLRRLVLDTEVGDRTGSADLYWELRF